MKLYETKKLHYDKYFYKFVVVNKCASFFRTEFQPNGNLKYCQKRLDEVNEHFKPNKNVIELPLTTDWRWKETIPTQHFFDAINIYRHLKKHKDYKIRCEINMLHVYSNNRKMLIDLSNKVQQQYSEFWEPNPENIELLSNKSNIIIVNKPPEYEYKITLGKKPGLPSLAKWIDNNPKLAKMGDTAKQECYNNGWVKGYYFHIRDKKTLSLAQLLVGDNIQRIDKFVYVPT